MKKITIILILVAVLSAYPVFNIVGLARDSVVPDETDLSEGRNIIETLVGFDVRKAQKNVTSAEKKRNERLEGYKSVNQILKNLDSGKTTYRKVFKNVYIVGDSLMNGLEAYNILNSNHLITQVSASLYHLDGNVRKIIKINPPVLILHYGVNMIATDKKYLNNYIVCIPILLKSSRRHFPIQE